MVNEFCADLFQESFRITVYSTVVIEFEDIRGYIYSCVQHLTLCIRSNVTRIQVADIAAGKLRHQRIVIHINTVMYAVLIIGAPKHLGRDISHIEDRILCQRNDLDLFFLRSSQNIVTAVLIILHITVRTVQVSVIGKIKFLYIILPVIKDIDHIPYVVMMIMTYIDIKIIILSFGQPVIERVPCKP